MLHAARCKYSTHKSRQKSPSGHHRTTSSGYIFARRHVSTIGTKLLNSNISSTCPHKVMNVGSLAAEIGSGVWGTAANFNGFRVLASLLHRRLSTEVNQTLHHVWPSRELLHCTFWGLLPSNGILPGAKFTLRHSLAFSYAISLTAWHSSSGRKQNFAAWYLQATGRPCRSTCNLGHCC